MEINKKSFRINIMNKVKILDGGMGSELIRSGEELPEHIWSAKINLTNPNLICEIHKKYIKEGANYITTNTFRTTPRAFKKIGLTNNEAYNHAQRSFESAINMAKKASSERNKILGSIAPLEDCYLPKLFPGEQKAKKEFIDAKAEWWRSHPMFWAVYFSVGAN